MPPKQEELLNALKKVNYPGFTRDIVSFGIVNDIKLNDSSVVVSLLLPKEDKKIESAISEGVNNALLELPGVSDIQIEIGVREQAKKAQETPAASQKLPDIKYYIAIASGKGGVGKSTVAVNVALAIAKKRQNVGLMDADIWGPSAPIMMGINERPAATGNQKILPIEKFGLKVMSIGFLVNEEDAVIWRGPMVHGAIKQFIEDVEWKGTDYLVIDLPPGTGDAQLSLAQTVPLSGGVIVTTPQDVALIDVKRGILMFQKLNVPVIGIVENMSYLELPDYDKPIDIFGRGGGKKMADKFNVPYLGEIPLDPEIRIGGDTGNPIINSNPDCKASKTFMDIADKVLNFVE